MSDRTDHLALPYLASNQAGKHVTLNESLSRLDNLVHLSVEHSAITAPPVSPQPGDRYIIAADASGEFDGHSGQVAYFADGAWQYVWPMNGWRAWDKVNHRLIVFEDGQWRDVIGGTVSAGMLGVNASPDEINRISLASPASLFSHEGASHQLKINKAADTDTASILFQSNWSGAAEIGCVGERDFSVKTSADGAAFTQALRVESATGVVRLPANPRAVVNRVTASEWYGSGEWLRLTAAVDTHGALDPVVRAWRVPVSGLYLCAMNFTVRDGDTAPDVRLKLQRNGDGDPNKLLEVPIANYTLQPRGAACVINDLTEGDEVFLVIDSSDSQARFRFWETRASLALL